MIKVIREVIDKLANIGVVAVAAGGCARDILHGKSPKDIDLFVLNNRYIDVIFDIENAFDTCKVYSQYDGDTGSRVRFVVKLVFQGVGVDIIQYETDFTGPIDSPERQVECFDCTLNMAWVDHTGTVKVHPDYPKMGGKVRILPLCDYPENRAAYLSSKYPEYDWSDALNNKDKE